MSKFITYRYKISDRIHAEPRLYRIAGRESEKQVKLAGDCTAVGYSRRLSIAEWNKLPKTVEEAKTEWLDLRRLSIEAAEFRLAQSRSEYTTAINSVNGDSFPRIETKEP